MRSWKDNSKKSCFSHIQAATAVLLPLAQCTGPSHPGTLCPHPLCRRWADRGFGGWESCSSPPPPVFAQDSLRGNRPTLQQEESRLDGKEISRCMKGGCSEMLFVHLFPQW